MTPSSPYPPRLANASILAIRDEGRHDGHVEDLRGIARREVAPVTSRGEAEGSPGRPHVRAVGLTRRPKVAEVDLPAPSIARVVGRVDLVDGDRTAKTLAVADRHKVIGHVGVPVEKRHDERGNLGVIE